MPSFSVRMPVTRPLADEDSETVTMAAVERARILAGGAGEDVGPGWRRCSRSVWSLCRESRLGADFSGRHAVALSVGGNAGGAAVGLGGKASSGNPSASRNLRV